MQKKVFGAILGLAMFSTAMLFNFNNNESNTLENAKALAGDHGVIACTDCDKCGPCLLLMDNGKEENDSWMNHFGWEITVEG